MLDPTSSVGLICNLNISSRSNPNPLLYPDKILCIRKIIHATHLQGTFQLCPQPLSTARSTNKHGLRFLGYWMSTNFLPMTFSSPSEPTLRIVPYIFRPTKAQLRVKTILQEHKGIPLIFTIKHKQEEVVHYHSSIDLIHVLILFNSMVSRGARHT